MNPSSTPFQDMRGLLRLSGIVAILGGLCFACLGGAYGFLLPFLLHGTDLPDPSLESLRQEIPEGLTPILLGTAVCILLLSAGVIWLGIGSFRIKKWARDLLHAAGWLGAVLGILGTVSQLIHLPRMMNSPALASPGLPPGAQDAVMILSVVAGLGFYLAPAVFLIIVYGLKHIRLTVAHHDPSPSWTDGLSPHLLAWWLLLVVSALTAFPSAFTSSAFLAAAGWGDRTTATAAMLLGGGISATLAWLVARRHPLAWPISLAVAGIGGALAVWMAERLDLAAAYRAMGYSGEQLEVMELMVGSGSLNQIPAALSWIGLLGFLLWRRRDFSLPAPETVTR